MRGVHFVIDSKGRKTAVQIDLKLHARLWENFYDCFVAESRKHEPRESMESVVARIEE